MRYSNGIFLFIELFNISGCIYATVYYWICSYWIHISFIKLLASCNIGDFFQLLILHPIGAIFLYELFDSVHLYAS